MYNIVNDPEIFIWKQLNQFGGIKYVRSRKKAPDFELPDQNGEMHKLSDYAGKK